MSEEPLYTCPGLPAEDQEMGLGLGLEIKEKEEQSWLSLRKEGYPGYHSGRRAILVITREGGLPWLSLGKEEGRVVRGRKSGYFCLSAYEMQLHCRNI